MRVGERECSCRLLFSLTPVSRHGLSSVSSGLLCKRELATRAGATRAVQAHQEARSGARKGRRRHARESAGHAAETERRRGATPKIRPRRRRAPQEVRSRGVDRRPSSVSAWKRSVGGRLHGGQHGPHTICLLLIHLVLPLAGARDFGQLAESLTNLELVDQFQFFDGI